MAQVIISKSSKATQKIAADFVKKIKKNKPNLILLIGDLGVGKTEWVKGFVSKYLGSKVVVTSPTYSLINGYKNNSKVVYHIDLYRLKDADDLESIGFWDLFEKNNTVIVEWGQMLNENIPGNTDTYIVDFKMKNKNDREIRIYSESNEINQLLTDVVQR